MPLTNTIGSAASRSYGFLTSTGIGGSIVFYSNSYGSIYSTSGTANSSQDSFYTGTIAYNWTLFKSSANGLISWQKTITGPTFASNGFQIKQDSSGNTYSIGYDSAQFINGWAFSAVYKFNSSGNLVYRGGIYPTGANDYVIPSTVTTDSSSNTYLFSLQNNTSSTYSTALITKYDSTGAYQWTYSRYIATTGYVVKFTSAITDSSGNIYAVGYFTYSSASGYNKPLLMKINSSGTTVFQKALTDTVAQSYYFNSIATDGTYFYCAGNTLTSDGSTFEILLTKYDSSGAVQWKKRLHTSSNVTVFDCIYDSGNIYITGSFRNGSINNAIVLKLDNNGNFLWQKRIGTTISLDGMNFAINANNMVVTAQITTTPNIDLIKFTFPVDNGISGTYTAGGYTFTCANISLLNDASTLTDTTTSISSGTPSITQQSTFGTVNNVTNFSSSVTPI